MKKFLEKTAGFTLVELMITIAILAILLTVAIPSFSELIRNNQMVVQTDRFARDLNYARSEAIKLRQQVSICKSAIQTACQTGATNWEDGWIVFSDDNGDGSLNGADNRLRVSGGLDDNFTLRVGGSFTNWVAYVASGTTRGSGGTADTYVVCRPNATAAESRRIVINIIGRVSVRAGTVACP